MLFARLSPSGKLIVDVAGLASGTRGHRDVARLLLAGDREVAGDRDRVARDAEPAGDLDASWGRSR